MTDKPRLYQVRIFLRQEFADAVNRGQTPKEIQPLLDILAHHKARIDHNQFNEFTDYVNNWKTADVPFPASEREALRDLTKKSLADPEKRSWFKREFTLSIEGVTMLDGDKADKLIADLQTLGDGAILIKGKAFAHGPGREVTPVRKTYVPRHHPGT